MISRLLGALALLVFGSGLAEAHAYPKSAEPVASSVVKAAPGAVTIAFSEALEPQFSTLTVVDAAGNGVDLGDAAVAPADAKRLSVHLRPLGPGVYKVAWHVTSVDAHKTEGSYSFTVAP